MTIWCSQRCTKWAFYPLFQSLVGRGPDLTCYRQIEYFTNTDLTDRRDTMNPNCATTMVVLQCDCMNVLFVTPTLPSEKDQRLHLISSSDFFLRKSLTSIYSTLP